MVAPMVPPNPLYHSVVDAIFGALTLPDIGQVFQDTDPRWKGCDSSKFMEHAYEVMNGYGDKIGNIDVTLILERPKLFLSKTTNTNDKQNDNAQIEG